MRIIIDIDGATVVTRADASGQELTAPIAAAGTDAGSAPVELLRQHAAISQGLGEHGEHGTGERSPDREGEGLNPLRAGEKVARKRLRHSVQHFAHPLEIIDAGSAPKALLGSEAEPRAKQPSRKK
ncbi:MAG TPA: hypothetical protein VE968_06820 [Sphingomicrobium sp.]|nr:hypothetical protein [Sphingomicrobium sp.]